MATNENIEVLQSLDKEYIVANMNAMLSELGNNIKFEYNVWLCDKASKVPMRKSSMKIYFTMIPNKYLIIVKYYVLISIKKFTTIKCDVQKLGVFLKYLVAYENSTPLINVNQATIERYRRHIDKQDVAKSTKVGYMQVLASFFWKLDGWEDTPTNNPVNKRVHLYKRKKSDNEIKTRYIPDSVTKELDKIFFSEEIYLYFRLYYWFCRMYPSRCSEISSLKIGCIKPLDDLYYVWFKEEEKSSNDLGGSNILNIRIKYEGWGKYLIDLYHEQEKISELLQDKVSNEFKGLLFLYNPITTRYKKPKQQKRICLVLGPIFNKFIKKLCKEEGLIDGLGEDIKITTHCFRHNGITDRLYEDFSPTSIRDLTGQKSDGEVIGAYHYRKKDEIEKLQKKALKERFSKNKSGSYENTNNQLLSGNLNEAVSLATSKVMFRGRIMNLDDNREQRLLANKRAYQISYSDRCIGICTEIASCNNGIFNCFKCNDFAPDSNELDFFKEQVNYWEERIEYFQIRGNQFQMEHSIEVKGLFEAIVLRIEDIKKRNGLAIDNE